MLIIFNETTVLNVKTIQSIMIKATPYKEKTLINKGFLWLFPMYKETDIPHWTLEFIYSPGDGTDGRTHIFKAEHKDYDVLKKTGKAIIQQIKNFDVGLVNVAFEDAFLKD